jgi:hypothetical protein
MTDEYEDSQYPEPVATFHSVLRRFRAIRAVDTGLKSLEQYPPQTYSLPHEFGDLPHALLRRTNGALSDEFWAHTEVRLTSDAAGWRTLEFIAWWIRDLSRSGTMIQLRPMALPPQDSDEGTLKFIIDHLVQCPNEDVGPMLRQFEQRSDELQSSISLYRERLDSILT